jgi:lipopolysaccharide assembly protein A
MRVISYIFLIIVVLFGIGFACLNAEMVTVDLYIGQYQLQLSILLVLTLGLGILIGFFTVMLKYLRLKTENMQIKNRARWAEKEVKNLRSIPLQDGP